MISISGLVYIFKIKWEIIENIREIYLLYRAINTDINIAQESGFLLIHILICTMLA